MGDERGDVHTLRSQQLDAQGVRVGIPATDGTSEAGVRRHILSVP